MMTKHARILPLLAVVLCGCGSLDLGAGGPSSGGPGGSGGSDNAPFPQFPGAGDTRPFEGGTIECFYGPNSTTKPAAAVEYVLELVGDKNALRTRLTMNPDFVDNTYGANAIGWGKRGHTFEMLVRSDHAQIYFANQADPTTALLDIKIDYISASGSGFKSLGISGGDGALIRGSAADVLRTSTSLDRNLNERGYGKYTVDSPATDATFKPNTEAPNWDYRVVYEAWIRADAFSPPGRGRAFIDHIHASPSKTVDTIYVTPAPCPPEWRAPGSRLPGGSTCTSNMQCASLTCLKGKCLDEGGGGTGLPGGSACTTNANCASLTCINGTCVNEGGAGSGLPGGSTCSVNAQCASGSCVNGRCLNEGGGSGLPGGSACSTNANCASLTCVNGTCINEGGNGTGLPGGSACSTNANCASLTCINGSCVNESGGSTGLPGGSACSTNAQCISLTCSAGTCIDESGFPDGAPCSTNAQCRSLTCVQGRCQSVIN